MLLTPGFLIGGAVAAVAPLILHLLQRRRRTTVAFPTLRFLKLAEQKSSRRMRIENLLLWLLRTAILLLLGLAFAMPVLRAKGLAWLGNAPRDVAIVIDASYSMAYQAGRATVWDEALEVAAAIIEGLGDNDRYCLYLARDQPEPLIAEPVGAREQGLQVLKAATLKTTGSRLTPTLQAARSALDREKKGREREVYVLTDGQAVAWQSVLANEEADPEPGPESSPPSERTTHFVALLGAPSPVNLSPVSLTMNPPLITGGTPARIEVRTLHTGPDRESTLRLVVGGKDVGRRPLRLGARDAGEVAFTMPPREPGIYAARIESPDDALIVDNTFHFLVRVRDRLPILCVGNEKDTVYVRTALKSAMTGGPGLEPKRVDSAGLAEEPLHEMAAVFLCNALPLPGQAMAKLEQYVQSGGLLVLFPGDRAALEDYRPWACLPGEVTSVVDIPTIDRNRTLVWAPGNHPLLLPFQGTVAPPRITVRRSLAWGEPAEQTQRLIAQGPGRPFLLERTFGEGKVLMFAVSGDRTWSDLPLSPFYLPLLAQTVEYGAGVGLSAPFLWATDALPLARALPGATRETALVGPDGNRLPVSSALVNGVAELMVEGLETPGMYEVAGTGPALAVNMRRSESDLSPLSAGNIEDLLAADDIYFATDSETLQQLITEHRIGRTYGEHILWIVLLFAGLEFFYANRLLRNAPSLSAQLKVAPSGQVMGPAPAAATTMETDAAS